MKKLYLISLCILILFSTTVKGQILSDSIKKYRSALIFQFGAIGQHTFPLSKPSNQIGLPKYITTKSRSTNIDKGFMFDFGYAFNERFDVLTGMRLIFNELEDDPNPNRKDYDLQYKRIYLPIMAKYHLIKPYLLLDCIELELAWSRMLSTKFGWDSNSQVDAGWHETNLSDLNNKNPVSISIGIGKSFSFNGITLFLTPYFQYDLNRNEILKGFYHPSTFGLKITGELRL